MLILHTDFDIIKNNQQTLVEIKIKGWPMLNPNWAHSLFRVGGLCTNPQLQLDTFRLITSCLIHKLDHNLVIDY